MRTVALALCCLMLSTPLAGCMDFLGSGDGVFDEPEPLRINHIQVLGTHNSYHIEPFGPTIRAYDYTHEALDIQAEDFGVRQFELDVWWILAGNYTSITINTISGLIVQPSKIV